MKQLLSEICYGYFIVFEMFDFQLDCFFDKFKVVFRSIQVLKKLVKAIKQNQTKFILVNVKLEIFNGPLINKENKNYLV